MTLSTEDIIALLHLPGVGPKSVLKMAGMECDSLDSLQLDFLSAKSYGKKVPVTPDMLQNARLYAKQVISLSEQNGIGIISYFDSDYPLLLKETVDEKGTLCPPLVLYYKGDRSLLSSPCMAIIGTRNPTAKGKQAASFLSSKFASLGFCIVSGLALGCDTLSHQGALSVNGKTIAILSTGLDSIYPKENEPLAQEILDKGGLLLSEYPLGTKSTSYNLVSRDRLQSALSLSTLVIQTTVTGGSLHASRACLRSGKPLYVVYFQDEATRLSKETAGNEMLVLEGGHYLKGSDDFSQIAKIVNGI